MNKEIFVNIGWLVMIGIVFAWLKFGYSSWYLLFALLAYASFSVADGSIKKITKVKKLPIINLLLILIAFIISVGIVFGLIYVANYLIISSQVHLWIPCI